MQAVLLLLKLRKTLGDGTGTLIDSSIEMFVSLVLPVLMHFTNTKFTFACMMRRGKKNHFQWMLVLSGHTWGQKLCFNYFRLCKDHSDSKIHLFHKAFTTQTAAFNYSGAKPQLRGEFSLSSAKPRICTTTFSPAQGCNEAVCVM